MKKFNKKDGFEKKGCECGTRARGLQTIAFLGCEVGPVQPTLLLLLSYAAQREERQEAIPSYELHTPVQSEEETRRSEEGQEEKERK